MKDSEVTQESFGSNRQVPAVSKVGVVYKKKTEPKVSCKNHFIHLWAHVELARVQNIYNDSYCFEHCTVLCREIQEVALGLGPRELAKPNFKPTTCF